MERLSWSLKVAWCWANFAFPSLCRKVSSEWNYKRTYLKPKLMLHRMRAADTEHAGGGAWSAIHHQTNHQAPLAQRVAVRDAGAGTFRWHVLCPRLGNSVQIGVHILAGKCVGFTAATGLCGNDAYAPIARTDRRHDSTVGARAEIRQHLRHLQPAAWQAAAKATRKPKTAAPRQPSLLPIT